MVKNENVSGLDKGIRNVFNKIAMPKKIRVLTSRELSVFELHILKKYLSTSYNKSLLRNIEDSMQCKQCSLHMIPNDGFDGTIRCDCNGDSFREYSLTF